MAIVSWSSSIFLGLKSVEFQLKALLCHNDYYTVTSNIKRGANTDQKHIIARNVYIEKLNSISLRGKLFYKWQTLTFYGGVIFFIVWHILEMSLK